MKGTALLLVLCLLGSALSQTITLTEISTTFSAPIGIDYYSPTNSLVLSAFYPYGSPHNFELVHFDGSHEQFSEVAGLTDEIKITTTRPNNIAGWPEGNLFTGNGYGGQILRILADGTPINPWVVLPGEYGLIRGSLYIDDAGTFNGDLIVVTTAGGMWRVTKDGVPTRLANVNTHLEGLIVVPNNPSVYGVLAGLAIAGAEGSQELYAVDNAGNLRRWSVNFAIEDIDLIKNNENFFGIDYGNQRLLGAPASEFAAYVGKILVSQEAPAVCGLLEWDFVNNRPTITRLNFGAESQVPSQWEHVTFAPAGVVEVPPTETCDPIAGTYRTQTEGDWGDDCSQGFIAGCYRDLHFDECFPDGFSVGCSCDEVNHERTNSAQCGGHHLFFSSSEAVKNFLPQLGRPGPLTKDYTDPNADGEHLGPYSTEAGNFAGQVSALALSLGFDSCIPSFSTVCNKTLHDLFICDARTPPPFCEHKRTEGCIHTRTNNHNEDFSVTGKPRWQNCLPFYGWTVGEVFEAARSFLGGCTPCNKPKYPPVDGPCTPEEAAQALQLNTWYQVGDHIDGSIRPPKYCLRIDNLHHSLTGATRNNREFTFSCDTTSNTALYFKVLDDGNGRCGDVLIEGSVYGGRDAGNDWRNPAAWEVQYRIPKEHIDQCTLQDGTIRFKRNPGNVPYGNVTLRADQSASCYDNGQPCFQPGHTVQWKPQTDGSGNYFNLAKRHRGYPGLSGWGWVNINRGTPANPDWYHKDSQDWLFGICPIPQGQRAEGVDENEERHCRRDETGKRTCGTYVPPPADVCDINQLNECVAHINQEFVFGRELRFVPTFSDSPCSNLYEVGPQ